MKPIEKLLHHAAQSGASDLHIAAGMPPMVRIFGELKPISGAPVLTPQQTEALIQSALTPTQKAQFEKDWDLDCCLDIPNVGRFRTNLLKQRKGTDAVFRYIPPKIPDPTTLGLTEPVLKLIHNHQGLVLITGPTRSGKTTTMASLVQVINSQEALHIITVEDPIEFTFPDDKALINQREVGKHTRSTSNALRAALREDPDIIMVGEMRDLETVQLAISAAETGHLVLSTLQTQNAYKTIDRIVDSYPSAQQAQIRTMLSESLRGVISQQLIKRADGKGMVLALEIMIVTPSLSNLIRDGKTFQIPSIMQTGAAHGMKRMDDSLIDLMRAGIITQEEAVRRADKKKDVLNAPKTKAKVAVGQN